MNLKLRLVGLLICKQHFLCISVSVGVHVCGKSTMQLLVHFYPCASLPTSFLVFAGMVMLGRELVLATSVADKHC